MNNINLDSAKDTLCKNILIYGYCKFEDKGCAFNHNKSPQQAQQQQQSSPMVSGHATASAPPGTSGATLASYPPLGRTDGTMTPPPGVHNETKRKFNLNTPSFQPGPGGKFSPKIKNTAPFVPEGFGHDDAVANTAQVLKKFNVSTPSFTPQSTLYGPPLGAGTPPPQSMGHPGPAQPGTPTPGLPNPYQMAQGTGGGLEVFFGGGHPQGASFPLQHHLYAPAPPPRLQMPIPPYETNSLAMFIPNELREQLQRKNDATLQTIPRLALPDHVHVYHLLVPIDKSYDPTLKTWTGVATTVYKAFSNIDGNPYAMRRVNHGFEISDELSFASIKRWKLVRSPNVVHVQDAFTTMAFGGESSQLIVVYDYYPNASTLSDYHKKTAWRTEPITEDILWSYLVQLVSAITAIHAKGLAARRSVDINKIIVTSKNRIRLSGCAVSDILAANLQEPGDDVDKLSSNAENMAALQRRDIALLGQVMIDLCAYTLPQALRQGLLSELLKLIATLLSCNFLQELLQVLNLLNDDSPEFDLDAFTSRHLTAKMMTVLNASQDATDYMEAQLTLELENARLFRLMAKLNFVIDRPEQQKDWLENGPKYIVKLFRDYIFLQYDDYGKPVVDLARVLSNLNKLDAGIDEKFLLVSRDEKQCIIVSYKEIRDTIDSLFRNLTRD